VVSLFDGIAIGQQALKQLGFGNGALGGYHAFEVNGDATNVATSNHKDITHHGDVKVISDALLAQIIRESGPIRLVVGGPPCPNLCLCNADRRGVLGEGAVLLHYFYIVLFHLRILQPDVTVHFLMENVQGMAAHNKQYISTHFAVHDPLAAEPIEFNSKLLGVASRPRLYWTNVPGARLHMAKLKHSTEGCAKQLQDFLDPGRSTDVDSCGCMLRTRQKDSPVDTGDGQKGKLNVREVERVMVGEGYTGKCGLSDKARLELLGDSWHLDTITQLLSPLLTPKLLLQLE
jgi:hypothetical protein